MQRDKTNRKNPCVIIYVVVTCLVLFCIGHYLPQQKVVTNYEPNSKKVSVEEIFIDFVNKYNKSYRSNDSEYFHMLNNFKQSDGRIKELNDLEENNVYGYSKFSDMTEEEFMNNFLIDNVGICEFRRHGRSDKIWGFRQYPADIPGKMDWREIGVVGPVLDQKLCRGCWSFGLVETMESRLAIVLKENGTVTPFSRLSIQEPIDCSKVNDGCRGGKPATALKYLTDHNIPLLTEEQYPLKLIDQDCMINNRSGVTIRNYTNLCNVDEEYLLRLIANHGPVVAAVNARTWQYYVGGVIKQSCSGNEGYLNHVVQIVGYDLTAPTPHYIVRNSWGKDFGDKGYVMIAIGGNVCGVADEVSLIDV